MDAAAADELRGLRARAYGPDADIADDAAALARLYELEAQAGDVSSPSVSAPSPPPPRQAAPETPTAAAATDVSRPSEPADVEIPSHIDESTAAGHVGSGQPSRRRRWWRSRPVTIALAAAAVVAIIGATATIASMQTRSNIYGAPVEAVLTAIPGAEIPDLFGSVDAEGMVFADFYGLTPMSATMSIYAGGQGDCLALVETSQLATATGNSIQGVTFYGCGAGPFAPTISLIVNDDMPQEVRDRYPVGTALQFALEPDGVVVLSGVAPEDEAAMLIPE